MRGIDLDSKTATFHDSGVFEFNEKIRIFESNSTLNFAM